MTSHEDIWRTKTDGELHAASAKLNDYTEETKRIILAELSRRSLPEGAPFAHSQPEVAGTPAFATHTSPAGNSAVVDRYRDAYRSANMAVSLGALIKGAAVIIFVLLTVLALAKLEGPFKWGAILAAAVVAILVWLAGLATSALGQLNIATLDSAVHSSPFMTNEQRASAMSLPVSGSGAPTVT